ncbi:MAG: fibronectin type III domain-containing protein [Clostridiales Family XIII bacterium]|jgi:hypothetical protein|nr:fibronectin type III domain-containing protein [Clostridiales Family XIII bacterium]
MELTRRRGLARLLAAIVVTVLIVTLAPVQAHAQETVSFRLIGATLSSGDTVRQTWIPTTSYNLTSNMTAADLVRTALARAGMSVVFTETSFGSYISSVRAPSVLGGYTLAEFSNGSSSGWMFIVNNKDPGAGISDTYLSPGVRVILFYENDFNKIYGGPPDYALHVPDFSGVPDVAPTAGGSGGLLNQPAADTRIPLSSVTLTAEDKTWTGSRIRSGFKVMAKYSQNGNVYTKSLKAGTDYDISSSGSNKAIGKGTVRLSGKGSFTGEKDVTFRIMPKKVAKPTVKAGKGQIQVTWKKGPSAAKITTYQVRYRVKGATSWTVKPATSGKASLTVKKLKKGKYYQVQVRAYKQSYYGAWSALNVSAKKVS